MWIFPSPSLSAPCCLLLQGCSCVLGIWAGRGRASSTAQPLFATVSHSPMEPLGSAMSQGQEGCSGSQTPGDDEVIFPHFTACSKNRERDILYLASTLEAWLLFWGSKIMRGVNLREVEQFSRP